MCNARILIARSDRCGRERRELQFQTGAAVRDHGHRPARNGPALAGATRRGGAQPGWVL